MFLFLGLGVWRVFVLVLVLVRVVAVVLGLTRAEPLFGPMPALGLGRCRKRSCETLVRLIQPVEAAAVGWTAPRDDTKCVLQGNQFDVQEAKGDRWQLSEPRRVDVWVKRRAVQRHTPPSRVELTPTLEEVDRRPADCRAFVGAQRDTLDLQQNANIGGLARSRTRL